MVMQVLDSPNFARYDTSSVRGVSYGGAPAPPDLVRRIREAPGPIGQPSQRLRAHRDLVGHVHELGRRLRGQARQRRPRRCPVTDVAVVPEDFAGDEPDDSVPRGPEVTGELWIKGPQRRAGLLEPARGDGASRSSRAGSTPATWPASTRTTSSTSSTGPRT